MQYINLEETVYFWFGSNDTSGSGADGASAVYDVRLGGATSSDAPILSGNATLLSHANYPAGAYEIAVAATAANGFAAGNSYAVFATLAVDSQNPTGFVGAFRTAPVLAKVGENNTPIDRAVSSTDQSVFIVLPKTGLVAADLTMSYSRLESDNDTTNANVTSSLNDLSALTDAHNDWGLKEVSSTLAPRLYRLDLADAVLASGANQAVISAKVTASGELMEPLKINLSTPLTVTDIAEATRDAILDATATDFNDAGTIGEKINSAASAGDPWATALPGAYGAGTAGKIIGDNINASISSRASGATAVSNTDLTPTRAAYLDQILDIVAQTNKLNTAMDEDDGFYYIKADVKKVKGSTVTGSGTTNDPWGP